MEPFGSHKNLHSFDYNKNIQHHGEISWPRQCVDLNSTFWIIGYWYCCNSCTNAKSKKHIATFQSWDPCILKVLPPSLSAKFPARLSHCSVLSNTAFEWMRSCFQNGMGLWQFSDALRVQHLLCYDCLKLQYYLHLAQWQDSLNSWRGKKYEAFLPFEDVSPHGHHGYIPSSQLLRGMYDGYIEKHQHDFHQHTAMLTAEICAIDHIHNVRHLKSFFSLVLMKFLHIGYKTHCLCQWRAGIHWLINCHQ